MSNIMGLGLNHYFLFLIFFFRGKGISWLKQGMGSTKTGDLDTLGRNLKIIKTN